jgi:hypothetical protein
MRCFIWNGNRLAISVDRERRSRAMGKEIDIEILIHQCECGRAKSKFKEKCFFCEAETDVQENQKGEEDV